MVGVVLGLSLQSKREAIIDALDTVHVIVTDERAELLEEIVRLQPDVLILDAYHAGNRELLATYRKVAPWGYAVLIYQQQNDLVLAHQADEIWPTTTLAMDKVKLLMRLAKFNRYRLTEAGRCKLAGAEGKCECACYKGLGRFFVGSRRFISPGAWGRQVFERWSFVFQHVAQGLGFNGIFSWPCSASVGGTPIDVKQQVATPNIRLIEELSALAGSGVQLEPLYAGAAWLLSVKLEGVSFPLAVILGKGQREQHTEYVAEWACHSAISGPYSVAGATMQLLSDTICQVAGVLSHEYSIALRSYRQCVFCREIVTDKAYQDAVSTAAALGVLLLDAKRRVIFANDLAVRLLTSGQQVTNALLHTSPIPEEVLDKALALDSADARTRILLPSVDKRVVVFAARAISARGETLGYAVTLQEEIKAEALWGEARLRERLASVGELAAGMAHEIRNPLTSIQGFMQLLKERLVAAGMAAETRYSDYALEEIDRANHVITNFLTLAKPRDEVWLPVDIDELLTKMLQLVENQAVLKGVCLTWQFAPDLPQIQGKAEALVQVFLNIVTNALQATPKGGSVHITTRKLEESVLISIQDTGNGMSTAVQEHIFTPFYSTKEGGTGLGLALCRQIVEEHNGRIQVTSTVGVGSCFFVSLPATTATSCSID